MSVPWGPNLVVLLPGLALMLAIFFLVDDRLRVPALLVLGVLAGIVHLKWVPLRKK